MAERTREQQAVDIPQALFSRVRHRIVRAAIVSVEHGVLAGTGELENQARALGLRVRIYATSGSETQPGQIVATLKGNPVQVVRGEDILLGVLAKPSGVATAAREARRRAGDIKVVCGAWKKMPLKIKQELREALDVGGAHIRILPEAFLYLDKNYIRIFGSLHKALEASNLVPGRQIVIQLRGETGPIAEEALTAARYGARVLMVDTGRIGDLRIVSQTMNKEGLRDRVQIAFAGGIRLNDLDKLRHEDLDIVDIGRAVLDAPFIDFRYDVTVTEAINDSTTAV